MFTNVDDLFDFVEQRNREFRREASAYRQAQTYRLSLVPSTSRLGRIHSLMARLHLVRPISGRAEAAA